MQANISAMSEARLQRGEEVSTSRRQERGESVRVVIRSNLDYLFIIDCTNQALAWMHIQEKMDMITPLGLTGAVEVRNVCCGVGHRRSSVSEFRLLRVRGMWGQYRRARVF